MNPDRTARPLVTLVAGVATTLMMAACNTEMPLRADDVMSAFPNASMPEQAKPGVGSWQGFASVSLKEREREVATALGLGASGATLHFGSPLTCRLDISHVGSQRGREIYDVANSNGGWCDNALAGQLRTTFGPDDTATIELLGSEGKRLATGKLQPKKSR